MTLRDLALRVWFDFHGRPYRWGGDDPLIGFDCSGFVIEGLKSVGVLPKQGDWTAEGLLHDAFADKRRLLFGQLRPGCLCFWERGGRIGHVEVVWAVIGTTVLTIGASGGGSSTTSADRAALENAYVKVRPASPGYIAIDPFPA